MSKRLLSPKVALQLFIYIFIFIIFLSISLYRYDTVQLFQYDFGIFASIIWQLSQGKVAVIDHISLGNIIFLGDHFQPSLALLSPLFWFVRDIRVLLIEQAFVVVICAFIIQKIALKKGLTFSIGLAVSVMFLLYAGVESPLVTDWHPEPTAGLFLLLFIYAFLFAKNRLLAPVLALIFLGFKESNSLTLSFFIISCIFVFPKRRKELLLYLAGTIAWFLLATKIIIPYLSQRSYFYSPQLPRNISELTRSLGNSAKYEFVWKSLLSFSFLPLLAGAGLIPVLGEVSIRIIPLRSFFESFNLSMHYNFYLGIFLAMATIDSLILIIRKFNLKNKRVLVSLILIVLSLFVAKKVTNSPVVLATNPIFWKELSPREEIFSSLRKVPKTGSVASQNNLLPHLLLRKKSVMSINKGYRAKKPEIIVFDLSEGQNPNNFFPQDYSFFVKEKKFYENNKEFERIKTGNNNIYIFFKRK